MRVLVAYVAPGLELCIAVDVDDGATVDDVVRTSRIADRIGITADSHGFAIFGKRVPPLEYRDGRLVGNGRAPEPAAHDNDAEVPSPTVEPPGAQQ